MEKFFVYVCKNEQCGHQFITNDSSIYCCTNCGNEELDVEERLVFVFNDLKVEYLSDELSSKLKYECMDIQDTIKTKIELPKILKSWFEEKSLVVPKTVNLSMDKEYEAEDSYYEYLGSVSVTYNDSISDVDYCSQDILDNLRDFISDNLSIWEMNNNLIINL